MLADQANELGDHLGEAIDQVVERHLRLDEVSRLTSKQFDELLGSEVKQVAEELVRRLSLEPLWEELEVLEVRADATSALPRNHRTPESAETTRGGRRADPCRASP